MTQRMTDMERGNKLKDLINAGGCSADDILEALAQSREEGFEEAAMVCDRHMDVEFHDDTYCFCSEECAKAIRALRPGGKGEK